MDTDKINPQALIALTNWRSRVCIPSDVYTQEFKEWAHTFGAYLYLVLIGPRTEIHDLVQEHGGWKVRAAFHDGTMMRPRTIPVPFEVIPANSIQLIDGAIESNDSRRMNAVEVARLVLDHALRRIGTLDNWQAQTVRKLFIYRVEYIGQSYGDHGERTAAERIGQGHQTVQQVLAETMDHHPNSAVAFIAMDAQIQRRELSGSIGPDNIEEMSRLAMQILAEPDGPLVDRAKLVTVAEAMLIRCFPEARNKQYKDFPLKGAPMLVGELLAAGISHVGVEIDVQQSMALIRHPYPERAPSSTLRFGVNLATGGRETLPSTSPLAWRED